MSGRHRGVARRRSNSALLNGSTWMPSLLVASGNRMRSSPSSSRSRIASRCCAGRRRGRRSMKIVRCSLASQPKSGQCATLGLGDEGAVDDAAEDRDVEIGGVVGDEQRRPARASASPTASTPKPRMRQTDAVIEAREAARERALERPAGCLDRHQRQSRARDRAIRQSRRRRPPSAISAATSSRACRS